MQGQQIIEVNGDYGILEEVFPYTVKSILLVCDSSMKYLNMGTFFKELESRRGIKVVVFDRFQPNPLYESVVEGINLFKSEKCEIIVAVGGGSAIDVAKCIKLYSNMQEEKCYLVQDIAPNNIPFIAVPTTAGTGSEATRFAVIYYNGEKQSIAHESCIPETVIFDASVLKSLPDYHRKSSMLDALCHAIESCWSVNSTEKSRQYSLDAIQKILKFKDSYLANEGKGNIEMLKAANIAGQAINITQTTAGHAMSYKITSLFGIAHGHAVALCIPKVWRFMLSNMDKCIDIRGKEYLQEIFYHIATAMGVEKPEKSIEIFEKFVFELGLEVPYITDSGMYDILRTSVNPIRLKNNPISLDEEAIDMLYRQILPKA